MRPQEDSDDEEWEEGFLEAHEELWPLKEALERAVMRKTEAIAQKEALEAKVGVPLRLPLSSPAVAYPYHACRTQSLWPVSYRDELSRRGRHCCCGGTTVALLQTMAVAQMLIARLDAPPPTAVTTRAAIRRRKTSRSWPSARWRRATRLGARPTRRRRSW